MKLSNQLQPGLGVRSGTATNCRFLLLLLVIALLPACNGERKDLPARPPADQPTPAKEPATSATMDTEPDSNYQAKTVADARSPGELRTFIANAVAAGDYDNALVLNQQLSELAPTNIDILMLLGNTSFAAGRMDVCVESYDRVIELAPMLEPQLWQRGLALYYADRFADGVAQFETHQTVNSQDVENAVWHLLCAAEVSDLAAAREKLIPITADPRVPMAEIYEMFAGRLKPADVVAASLKTNSYVSAGSRGHRLQQYYAQLYIGLFHEMLGEEELAKSAMEAAVELNPLEPANFMGQVARVHLKVKNKDARDNTASDSER